MNSMSRMGRVVLSLGLVVSLVGCAVDDGELGDAEEVTGDQAPGGEEEVASNEFKICTTAPTAQVFKALASSGDVASVTYATSPDTTYASSASGRYTMQVSGIKNETIKAFAEWGDYVAMPSTQAACLKAKAAVDVYGWDPAQGCWEKIASKTASGVWSKIFDTWYCSVGAGNVSVNTVKYTYVRVAGKAWTTVTLNNVPITVWKKVNVSVMNYFDGN